MAFVQIHAWPRAGAGRGAAARLAGLPAVRSDVAVRDRTWIDARTIRASGSSPQVGAVGRGETGAPSCRWTLRTVRQESSMPAPVPAGSAASPTPPSGRSPPTAERPPRSAATGGTATGMRPTGCRRRPGCSGTGTAAPCRTGPEPPGRRRAESRRARPHSSKADHGPRAGCRAAHGTILAMGSSMMSVAPWSFSAGMRVLMVCFGTTASTAKASSAEQLGHGRRLHGGQELDDRSEVRLGHVELDQHPLPGDQGAVQQGEQLLHGVALGVVGDRRSGLAISSV